MQIAVISFEIARKKLFHLRSVCMCETFLHFQKKLVLATTKHTLGGIESNFLQCVPGQMLAIQVS